MRMDISGSNSLNMRPIFSGYPFQGKAQTTLSGVAFIESNITAIKLMIFGDKCAEHSIFNFPFPNYIFTYLLQFARFRKNGAFSFGKDQVRSCASIWLICRRIAFAAMRSARSISVHLCAPSFPTFLSIYLIAVSD